MRMTNGHDWDGLFLIFITAWHCMETAFSLCVFAPGFCAPGKDIPTFAQRKSEIQGIDYMWNILGS